MLKWQEHKKYINKKTKSGDTQGANLAHEWANKIRQVMGVAGQYDVNTGAPITANPVATNPLEEKKQSIIDMIEQQKTGIFRTTTSIN